MAPSRRISPSVMLEKWQKTSSPPSAGLMNPNPRSFQRAAVPRTLPPVGGPVGPPRGGLRSRRPPGAGLVLPPVTSVARHFPLRSSYSREYSTRSPSFRQSPSEIHEKWQNTSSSPLSGLMNPKPRSFHLAAAPPNLPPGSGGGPPAAWTGIADWSGTGTCGTLILTKPPG